MLARLALPFVILAALAATPAAHAAAVVVAPVVARSAAGSPPVPAEVQKAAGFIGAMVRLASAPSATSAAGPGVSTGTVTFEGDRIAGNPSLAVAVKRSDARAAFVVQAGHWVTLSERQYAALTERLVIRTVVSWACDGSGEPVRSAEVVFGAPKGNLLPQGADTSKVRLVIPPAAAGIAGPPTRCARPAATVKMTLTADLPGNYPSGVPLGVEGLPVTSSTRLTPR